MRVSRGFGGRLTRSRRAERKKSPGLRRGLFVK